MEASVEPERSELRPDRSGEDAAGLAAGLAVFKAASQFSSAERQRLKEMRDRALGVGEAPAPAAVASPLRGVTGRVTTKVIPKPPPRSQPESTEGECWCAEPEPRDRPRIYFGSRRL